jgi:hypothetical protein
VDSNVTAGELFSATGKTEVATVGGKVERWTLS